MIHLQHHKNKFFQSMFGFAIQVESNTLKDERLKGARLSVYFRWAFICLILLTLSIQLLSGYKAESNHSLTLVIVYLLSNIALWFAVKRKYEPRYLGFLSAVLDVGIISYHLYILTSFFDSTAATAAATMFLFPIVFLLYTFRLDRGLLLFLILISFFAFHAVYFVNYFQQPEFYQQYLSLSPLSHIFKSVYILFIGFLCVYLQYSMSGFIIKQIAEAKEKASLDMKINIEREKNKYSQELIEQEKRLNRILEKEIQEKESMANELSVSKEQIQSIMSNLIGAASRCLFDEHLTVVFYSEKIMDITGYPASDFINNEVRTFASIIYPDDKKHCEEQILKAQLTKTPYEFEYRIIHKNGKLVWVKENGQCIFNEQGKLLYLDGITIDISDKKETEKKYQEIETRFRELTDLLPQPIYELDTEGNLIFRNKASDELFGELGRNDEGKVSALQVFVPEDIERVKNNIRDTIFGKRKQKHFEYRVFTKTGDIANVLIYGAPIIRDEKIVGTRGIIVDITELKKTEADLQIAKKQLEEINKNLSYTIEKRTHELTEANTQLIQLQKENIETQFNMLKQQVNPHFLFNSLNVLTSLIKLEPDLAEKFTEQLAKVYRYVLENKDKDLIPVTTEMEFLRAYIFLIDIRFMNKVHVYVEFDESEEDRMLLPLSLQLLIENAIKHNTFSKKEPLHITLYIEDDTYFVVKNNLQNRETYFDSTGVGLENIRNRYKLLTDKTCIFEKTNTHYIAKLPLLQTT